MQAYLRQADKIFTSLNTSKQPNINPNLFETGYKKLQEIFKSEYIHSSRSRFRWGSTSTYGIPDAELEAQEY
ncbi:hypothetical protein DFH28DRAFT_855828, partial [Melampsora americana]